MNFIFVILFVVLALGQPSQAFLGAKLALLSALTGGGGASGTGSGGYGSGGYNGGYNQGYYSGPPRSPVYYGNTGGYGYSRPSYGYSGGYGSGYGSGYQSSGSYGGSYQNVGDAQIVKVIKVIVPQQQSYSSGYASGYSSGWTPISAPAPAPAVVSAPIQPSTSYVTTQAVSVPAQRQYVQAPAPAPVQIPQPVQVSAPQPVAVTLQPPPPSVQLPIQVAEPQPQLQPVQISQPAPQNIQSEVKTIRVIVDEPSWNSGYSSGTPSQIYGAPPLSSGWTQNGGAWSGNAGWSNGFKSGSLWQKLGC